MLTPLEWQHQILAIKQTCVEANPLQKKHATCREHHLMGFKNRPKRERVCIFCGYCERDYRFSLAAVLMAAVAANPANRTLLTVESSGQFRNSLTGMLGPYWNLRDDSLDAQSEECISYLHPIVCP